MFLILTLKWAAHSRHHIQILKLNISLLLYTSLMVRYSVFNFNRCKNLRADENDMHQLWLDCPASWMWIFRIFQFHPRGLLQWSWWCYKRLGRIQSGHLWVLLCLLLLRENHLHRRKHCCHNDGVFVRYTSVTGSVLCIYMYA